jgi:ubiquitin
MVGLLGSLRRKRIEGRVAKDPEEENDSEDAPDVSRMKCVGSEWSAAHRGVGISKQHNKQERQREDQKWIGLEKQLGDFREAIGGVRA